MRQILANYKTNSSPTIGGIYAIFFPVSQYLCIVFNQSYNNRPNWTRLSSVMKNLKDHSIFSSAGSLGDGNEINHKLQEPLFFFKCSTFSNLFRKQNSDQQFQNKSNIYSTWPRGPVLRPDLKKVSLFDCDVLLDAAPDAHWKQRSYL